MQTDRNQAAWHALARLIAECVTDDILNNEDGEQSDQTAGRHDTGSNLPSLQH